MFKTTGIILLTFLVSAQVARAGQCKELTNSTRNEVLSYLSKRWKIGPTSVLTLSDEGVVRDSCYRRLSVEGGELKYPLTVFLSPDQRFVLASLLDMSVDPDADTREEAGRVENLLLSQSSPRRGQVNSPVTIVEFADFECPSCKRFAEWMAQLPQKTEVDVSLVYKHLPLPFHQWARDASIAASCADSIGLFWPFHDFVFAKQEELTAANFREHVLQYAATNLPDSSKRDTFLTCFDGRTTDAAVVRDGLLASRLHVSRTPTIFINGKRINGLHSFEQLSDLISEAGKGRAESAKSY